MATGQERAGDAGRVRRGSHGPTADGDAASPVFAVLRGVLVALWVVVDRAGLVVLFGVGAATAALVAGPTFGSLLPVVVALSGVLGLIVGLFLEHTRRYPPLF